MAETFKNFNLDMGTDFSATPAYTCPASTIAVVLHLQVANVDGTNAAYAYVDWTDDSSSDKVVYLANKVSVPAETALSVLTGKLVLEAGDTINAKASAASDLQLSGSVLEIS